MLVRLLYASRAVDDFSQEEWSKILSQSKANNPGSGITGVLCSSGRIFLQLLEGGRMQVNALYNHIAADPRHNDVVILSYEEISERRFAGWSMGLVNLERVNPSLLLKYSEGCDARPLRRFGDGLDGAARRTDGQGVDNGPSQLFPLCSTLTSAWLNASAPHPLPVVTDAACHVRRRVASSIDHAAGPTGRPQVGNFATRVGKRTSHRHGPGTVRLTALPRI